MVGFFILYLPFLISEHFLKPAYLTISPKRKNSFWEKRRCSCYTQTSKMVSNTVFPSPLVCTHLLPIIQLNSNLGTFQKEYCRYNYQINWPNKSHIIQVGLT